MTAEWHNYNYFIYSDGRRNLRLEYKPALIWGKHNWKTMCALLEWFKSLENTVNDNTGVMYPLVWWLCFLLRVRRIAWDPPGSPLVRRPLPQYWPHPRTEIQTKILIMCICISSVFCEADSWHYYVMVNIDSLNYHAFPYYMLCPDMIMLQRFCTQKNKYCYRSNAILLSNI